MGQNAYQRSLDYLYGLEKFGRIFGLAQVEKILKVIGDPHREVQAIHIGGTNGKGSTAAMIASILQKEGYRVGLYTSPHLIQFTERIKVDGKEIEKEEVAALAKWMRERIEEAGITPPFTFFDFTTAMALYYFSKRVVDLAILEVGLGGRLDSTNVVDPLLSIITNISKDHEAYLGKSILKIAGEKAGIIKEGVPVVSAPQDREALDVLRKVCAERQAPLRLVGEDIVLEEPPLSRLAAQSHVAHPPSGVRFRQIARASRVSAQPRAAEPHGSHARSCCRAVRAVLGRGDGRRRS